MPVHGSKSRLSWKYPVLRKAELVRSGIALLFALTVSGYPLMANVPVFMGIESRAFGVSLRIIVVLFSFFVIVFYGIRYKRFYSGWIWLVWGTFWILYIGRIAVDTLVAPIALSRPGIEYFAYAVGSCFVPMLALMVRIDIGTVRRALVYTYWTSLAAVVLLILGTLVLGLDSTYWPGTGRLGTLTLNPISLGHLAATLVILGSYIILNGNVVSRATRFTCLPVILLGVFTLFMAASRGPLLALIAAGCFLFWSYIVKGRKTYVSVTVVFLVFSVLSLSALYLVLSPESFLDSRFSMRGEDTLGIRMDLLYAAWEIFRNTPLFGGALEITYLAAYPHNVIVEGFMTTGIIGGMAFIGLLLFGVFQAARLVSCWSSYSWIGLLYIQYMTGAQISGSLYTSSTMWAMMGAVFGASSLTRSGYRSGRDRQLCCPAS